MNFHALALASVIAITWADDPASTYDQIFGQRARAVAATRDKADDLALAQSVLDAAKDLTAHRAAQAFFADKAYELSVNLPSDASRIKATVTVKEIERELATTPGVPVAEARPAPPKPVTPAPGEKPGEEKLPTLEPPLTIKDLAINQDVHFKIAKGPYTIDGSMKVTDAHHSKRLSLTVDPGVEIKGGTLYLNTRGHLHIKGDPNKPAVLRDMHIKQDLSASFTAENAIFVNVTFSKGGVWWASNSSKWVFTNCLLHKCTFPKLTRVDYGFRFKNCSFTFMSFPETESPFRAHWETIESCNFVNCTVPPTIGWCAVQSNFYGCEFPPGVKYNESGLTSDIYLFKTRGPTPQQVWVSEPNAGKVVVNVAVKPYEVFKFPVKPAIPELRADKTIAEILFK